MLVYINRVTPLIESDMLEYTNQVGRFIKRVVSGNAVGMGGMMNIRDDDLIWGLKIVFPVYLRQIFIERRYIFNSEEKRRQKSEGEEGKRREKKRRENGEDAKPGASETINRAVERETRKKETEKRVKGESMQPMLNTFIFSMICTGLHSFFLHYI